ncbi:bifunctional serine/threonine-protein kinase/formylglycine-generating enzyme family protein [Allorhodopirellula heiligendammensis]|uniref:non-specific serine/threonine protein kinase n=1 Tax=Allorhodopirellula heiligendammensis TaxID=2714739 RepID=A0A5C6BYG5_9BACT|nr:bifunctional serine/threonine-protein kinase/formylglycine-generating enzyme family protein [Allorhodopirellula heiligendammensis]TWU16727.1 Serine/threonine-protein kinase PknB [Allorhodopirellula heiligendammensis]
MSEENDSTKQGEFTCSADAIVREFTQPKSIGRYRVSGVIGKGSFGTVFRAVDDLLARDVAIKVLRKFPKRASSPSQWNAEARMAAMLDHPNIVPVYDVGSTDEYPFFVVSRFIEGIDLRERLQQRQPEIDQSLRWIIDMAGALQHAHEKGLVHRDVKPSNILIEKNDRPWLTDFGLAIHGDDIERQTDRKMLVGTYSYMSPEQARGEGHLVDGRADVFALGIVLYELLLGKRPFTGTSSEQLLENIVRAEPQPLRQLDPSINIELERICMRALAQRLSDRYASCGEFAEDLRRFADCHSTVDLSVDFSGPLAFVAATPATDEATPADHRVIPKGLRAFDEHDQDFFLKLVPGIRDAQGVPEIIRRLKLRIEARTPEDSFRVGLIYGASGSGKSSLIRAGLVPLLDESVHITYVEANAKHTESRLLNALSSLLDPSERPRALIETMASIRKGAVAGDKKVVVILDQFEQWLHAHPIMDDAELINAIRQCDGIHLQCIVLIRDDFWMAATRFFHELDIRLIQDVNSTAVERFDLRHARFVFSEFGRAYGCLPDQPTPLEPEQREFVHALVDSVAEDGKVISIHLVVLAQMLRGRDWNRKSLASIVGAEGIDVNFLDATFHDSIASPPHRAMEVPARAVLAELLPEVGSNIKGQMKDASRLREVSGLNQGDFDELVQALDGELRLITPTAAISADAASGDPVAQTRYYQLTHDFLVPPLREWLTRSDQQTPRGRAVLRLRELTQYWRRKREKRFLPSSLEYVRIVAFTSVSERSVNEQQLMSAATRYHGSRWALGAVIMLLVGWAALWATHRIRENVAAHETELGVQRLLASDTNHVLESITRLHPRRKQAAPLLSAVVEDPDRSPDEITAARLALIANDPEQTEHLIQTLLISEVDQINLICARLKLQRAPAVESLWRVVQSETVDELPWLRAAFALAQLDPDNTQWRAHAERLSRTIVHQGTPLVVEMAPGFGNIAEYLSNPVQSFFATPKEPDVRLNSAIILSKCLRPVDPELTHLLSVAMPDQFELLLPVAATNPERVKVGLRNELSQVASPRWPERPGAELQMLAPIDDETLAAIEVFEGIATDAFVLCQQLPLEKFAEFAEQLSEFGYRPACVRAYRFKNRNSVASIWMRDNLRWKFTRQRNLDEIAQTQTQMRLDGLYPVDITAIPEIEFGEEETEYGILWAEAGDSMIDSRVYVGLKEDEHQTEGWHPLNKGGYIPKSNLKIRDSDGQDRYSSVRWRTIFHPPSKDAWNDSQFQHETRALDGWQQADVRMNPVGEFDEYDISYAAVWWNGGTMQSKALTRLSHSNHLQQCSTLAGENFRPVSVSVVFDDNTDKLVAASVWHRPFVSDEDKDALASRQANAVIALLRLGASGPLWPLLESGPDPRLRSFLIDRMASLGADPVVLLNRLTIEKNDSKKFALIAALAHYRPEQLPLDKSSQLRELIREWGTSDPSAAVHSICSYLARQWKWPAVSSDIETANSPQLTDPTDVPTWYQNSQGQTMVAVSGPVEFQMGSPGHEAFREHQREVSLKMRIPRSFAIGASEVTVEQFQRYNPAALYATEYTLGKECPITSISWFDAMSYCRWLSEQEGILEDQMCYPSISDMQLELNTNETVTLPSDFLQRTGYRLPTEAEWEYCARSLTTTPRSFGNADELLPQYAWTTESSTIQSQVRFHPVKQLLPNDFGLFDTLGNVMESCAPAPPWDVTSPVVIDDRVNEQCSLSDAAILRGSAVFYVPTTMRSSKREEARIDSHHPYMGMRIARTMPAKSVSVNP